MLNTPGREDLDLTKKFMKAGRVIEIDILDHLIISEESYKSIIDDTLLDR
ncbi:hypothetical protein FNH22_03675 [Fulvivirga sp. M361]|nr:hypothetical protein FNH22_03675 [Fulvivirga sp. M361]